MNTKSKLGFLRRSPRPFAISPLLVVVFGQSSALAEITTYTSRAALTAAASQPLYTDDFEGIVNDTNLHSGEIQLLHGAATAKATAAINSAEQLVDALPWTFAPGEGGVDSPEISGTVLLGSVNADDNETLTLLFPNRLGHNHAVGFDFSGAAGYLGAPAWLTLIASCRVTTAEGTVHEFAFETDDGFLGFHDPDSPIISVEFFDSTEADDQNIANETFGIDNLTVSLVDSDGDGMPDLYEEQHGGLDAGANDASLDPDDDGLDNLTEFQRHTRPDLADSDGDTLSDAVESGTGVYLSSVDTGTHPLLADTDRDGLSDFRENPAELSPRTSRPGTNPSGNDSDEDGFLDGFEIIQGSDPLNPLSKPQNIARDLISFWPMISNPTGVIRDFVNGHHGKTSEAHLISANGKRSFGDYANFVSDNATLPIMGNDFSKQTLTISAWFKVDEFARPWQTIAGTGLTENGGWSLHRRGSEDRISFASGGSEVSNSGPAVNDGLWHHAVGVAEDGVGIRLYIDGELVATGGPPNLTNTQEHMMIGANPDPSLGGGGGRIWKGGIDDVAFWSRALNQSEIERIWNNGFGASIAWLLRPKLEIREFILDPETGDLCLEWISPTHLSFPPPPGLKSWSFHYNIERSTDLSNWTVVDFVLGNGEEIQSVTIPALPNAQPGSAYYRIVEKFRLGCGNSLCL